MERPVKFHLSPRVVHNKNFWYGLLSWILLFPIGAFAHLISISTSTPFPSTVSEHSISTATYIITNISSRAIITPINQSQFPKSLSILSSGLGIPLAPGESCAITLQLHPSSAQKISTALKINSQPTLDAVQIPIYVNVIPIETHDVIVIGAGISGLQAATVLQQNNMDVLILEARDSIGSQIETTTMDGSNTDLDASWLYDTDNNILTAVANSIPLKKASISKIAINGIPIPSTEIATIITNYPDLNPEITSQSNNSLDSSQDTEPSFLSNAINRISDYISHIFYNSKVTANTDCASSHLNQGHDAMSSMGSTHSLDQIFDVNSLNINFNAIVNKINYSNKNVVINTTNGKAYSAKYVLVAVPIGVLKANSIQFIPALSEPKLTAIQNLSNGLPNKVYLSFLLILTTSDYINQQQLTDTETANEILNQINLVLPEASELTGHQITRWGQDIYSLGSYSYPAMNISLEDIANLTLPEHNKLFFAGEVINQLKLGTADAAYTSGLDAASAILQTLNSQED